MKPYTDKQNGGPLKVGDVVEYDDERYAFVEDWLKPFGGDFLEKVKATRKKVEKVVDEE